MKRIVVIIIIIFPLINISAQNKDIYGAVYYKFKPNKNEVLSGEKTKQPVKDLFKGLHQFMADVKFKLEFLNKESIFTVEDTMDSEFKFKGGSIANKLISNGSYYCDLNTDMQLRKLDREEILIKTKPSSIKWELKQETKKINNYICYKATTSVTNKNYSGEYTFGIIAWYTPEIPVPFGPKQFNNLPGLILQLKDTHNTFYAEKIELFPKEKPIIKPFKGEIISEKKYKERVKEMMRGTFNKR